MRTISETTLRIRRATGAILGRLMGITRQVWISSIPTRRLIRMRMMAGPHSPHDIHLSTGAASQVPPCAGMVMLALHGAFCLLILNLQMVSRWTNRFLFPVFDLAKARDYAMRLSKRAFIFPQGLKLGSTWIKTGSITR